MVCKISVAVTTPHVRAELPVPALCFLLSKLPPRAFPFVLYPQEPSSYERQNWFHSSEMWHFAYCHAPGRTGNQIQGRACAVGIGGQKVIALFVNMRKLHLESIKALSPVGLFSWVKSNKFKELILTEKGNWLRTAA